MLPNTLAPIIVNATFSIEGAMYIEAALKAHICWGKVPIRCSRTTAPPCGGGTHFSFSHTVNPQCSSITATTIALAPKKPIRSPYCHRLAREWKIPRLTVEAFTMKSRSVAALAIENPMGHHRVAVIVFESTQANGFDLDTVREVLDAEVKRIRYFLEGMRPLEPSLEYASEQGF